MAAGLIVEVSDKKLSASMDKRVLMTEQVRESDESDEKFQ